MENSAKIIQRRAMPTPSAHLNNRGKPLDVAEKPDSATEDGDEQGLFEVHRKLDSFLQAKGDITHLLDEDVVEQLGHDVKQEWELDKGSIADWREMAERGLAIAAQDSQDDVESNFPWPDSADIHYPVLTNACQQFAARCYPEMVKGDKVVNIKVYSPEPDAAKEAQQTQQLQMQHASNQHQQNQMALQNAAQKNQGDQQQLIQAAQQAGHIPPQGPQGPQGPPQGMQGPPQ